MVRNRTQTTVDKAVLGARGEAQERPPRFVAPQLATLVASPPAGEEWLHEIKYDGYRAIAAIGGGRVRIYTRSGQDWTDKFAGVARALEKLRVKTALARRRDRCTRRRGPVELRVAAAWPQRRREPLTYYVFDLLELDGRESAQGAADPAQGGLADAAAVAARRRRLQRARRRSRRRRCSRNPATWASKASCRSAPTSPISLSAPRAGSRAKCRGNDEFVIGGYRSIEQEGARVCLVAARRVRRRRAALPRPRRHGL